MKAILGRWPVGVVAALIAALSFGLVTTAHAQSVPTKTTVGGPGTAPRIECSWQLPDMNSASAGIQYTKPATTHAHDDSAALPSVTPACSLPATGGATQPNNVRRMISVLPNGDDLPEEKQVELWATADHPNGISNVADVYWKVFHPDGSFKIQVHGTRLTPAQCTALLPGTADGSMIEATVHTGQASAAAFTDINRGQIAMCQESVKAVYKQVFSISKEQPCGEYKVEVHAVGAYTGQESVLVTTIDVICFFSLQIDFSAIDWGSVTPGLMDVVSGDLLFQPPNSQAPTVKNIGNHGMGVGIRFGVMQQVDSTGKPLPGAKIIDEFDACFGKTPSTIQCIGSDPANPIRAGVAVNFDNTAPRVLCSNEVGKLDLSIHPAFGLPGGAYLGAIDVLGRAVHSVCSTDQEVHTAG